MLRRGLHHDHESIGQPGLCEGGVETTARDLCGPLPPPLSRRERPSAASRRAPTALRHSLGTRSVQPQREPMQPGRVVDPLGPLREPERMPEMIEVRVHLHVHDAGLVLHHRLRHAPDGVMGRALGALAVRPRLEVRFHEGFPEARDGSLDHPVTDRRPRQHPDPLPSFLGHPLVPQPPGAIRAGGPCVPSLLQQHVEPAGLEGCQGDAVNTRRAVVGLGQWRGLLEGVRCADGARQAPETPGRCSRRLGVSPPAQVLQRAGWLCPLASSVACPVDR